MPAPLEIPLSDHRRIVLDVAPGAVPGAPGTEWRVAYYCPEDRVAARNLLRSARAGSASAREALSALTMRRTTGKAPVLSDALTVAMSTPDEPARLVEVVEISEYVLALEYAKKTA